MWVICDAATPASSSCRCVPSPGSKRTPRPSQNKNSALWLRVRVGTWLAVPSTINSRADIAGHASELAAVGGLAVRLALVPDVDRAGLQLPKDAVQQGR